MKEKMQFSVENVEASVATKKTTVEQVDANIEKESFDKKEMLDYEQSKLSKFGDSKHVRALKLISSMALGE
jgi:hypothetical protein